jgi:hypothetical protein
MSPDQIATSAQIIAIEKKIDSLLELIKGLPKPGGTEFEIFLTSKQVCDIYHISKATVSGLRTEGKLPYTDEFGVLLHPQSKINQALMESLHNGQAMQNPPSL